MKTFFAKLKKALIKLSFYVPTKLPVGMTEFNLWVDSVITAYDIPDNDSARFMLATMILHAPSTKAYVSKHYFGMCALKSMSNQVAAGVMQDLKQKQADAAKAEQEAPTGTA